MKTLPAQNFSKGIDWLARTSLFSAAAAVTGTCWYYNWPRTIENTEIIGIGTTQVAYDTGATDYLATSLDYKYVPKIYVKGHERCIAGEELTGLKVGAKLASISYSPSLKGQCDDLEDFVLRSEGE